MPTPRLNVASRRKIDSFTASMKVTIAVCLLQSCFQKPKLLNLVRDQKNITHLHRDSSRDRDPQTTSLNPQDPNSSGASLYNDHCKVCHGSLETSEKRNKSVNDIEDAIENVPSMAGIRLDKKSIEAIAEVLQVEELSGEDYFSCENDKDPPVVADTIQPLSKYEYTNTIASLFSNYIDLEIIRLELSTIPIPTTNLTNQNLILTQDHFRAYYNIAKRLSQELSRNSKFIADAFGEKCNRDLSQACLQKFAAGYAQKILRRPITQTQLNVYAPSRFEDDPENQIRAILHALLITPDFIFHLTGYGSSPSAQDPNLIELSSFELANRLSYAIWGTMPDDRLYELAARNELKDEKTWAEELKRLFSSPLARSHNAHFFTEWLRLNDIRVFEIPQIDLGGEYPPANYADEIIKESQDFINYISFEKKGNYRDLLTDSSLFPRSNFYKKVLSGSDQRPGILWRVVLANSRFASKRDLIHAGLVIRENLLCDPLHSPPASIADEVQMAVNTNYHELSARDQVTKKTADDKCQSCHKLINPLAFAGANNYDNLGRYITTEKSHDGKKEFYIDNEIEDPAIDNAGEAPLAGPNELATAIANSDKGPRCLVEQRYSFLLGRPTQPEAKFDGCVLKRAYNSLTKNDQNQSILRMIEALLGPELRYRRPLEK